MEQTGLTNQFSVCLTLDPKAEQAVGAIRETLSASPYRDDTPHITLLRTIKTPTPMSDTDLAQDMERLLGLSKTLPLTAAVHKPANRFSPLFRTSSLIILHASPEMKSYRKHILKILKANNYSVSWYERIVFFPHISIRLGVSYTEEAKAMAAQSFRPGTKLTFNRWIILRDIKKDGQYLVKEIKV
ncbi:MAG TPA: 2'-5' RNA ligase family protein [Candidatus Saccharimonadales bacterium]|nr:2'-5' RNA ligase family protein [Candidatus Saccharimonadales bacterium]